MSENMTLSIMACVKTNNVLIGTVYMILNWDFFGEKLTSFKLIN